MLPNAVYDARMAYALVTRLAEVGVGKGGNEYIPVAKGLVEPPVGEDHVFLVVRGWRPSVNGVGYATLVKYGPNKECTPRIARPPADVVHHLL